MAHARQDLPSKQPPSRAQCEDGQGDGRCHGVPEVFVDGFARAPRWQPRHDDEEQGDECKEERHNEGSPEGRMPVAGPLRTETLGKIGEDQGETDCRVDYVERIRGEIEHKGVCIACGGCQENDEGDDDVPTDSCKRCIERVIARKELGKGNEVASSKGLIQSALCKDDTEDVGDGGEGNKDAQSLGRAWAEDVLEIQFGNYLLTAQDILSRHGGEVGYLRQDVENGDQAQREGSSDQDGPFGVLDLAESVEHVGEADVGPDGIVRRRADAKDVGAAALKCVVEVARVWYSAMPR